MKFLTPLFLALAVVLPHCPIPNPVPSPPAPTPTPGAALALTVRENHFELAGVPIRLQGIGGVCCREQDGDTPNLAKEMGWPLITPDVIRQIAAAHGNFVAIRLGPFIRASEGAGYSGYAETADGRYNLDVFEPTFWARVKEIVEVAAQVGVFVEVDLWDGWMQRNAAEVSPVVAGRNVQGESLIGCDVLRSAPPPRIRDWVMKAVLETGQYANVLYLMGNENFVCGVQPSYEGGLVEAVRYVEGINHYPRHLLGTNSQRADMEAGSDYAERHASEAQDAERDWPVMVNELDSDSLSPEAFGVEMEAAVRRGTSFHLWLGQQTRAAFAQSLALMKASMEGHGVEVPASCPAWVKLKAGVFSIMAPDHATFLKEPVPDGFLRLDSTPFFDDGKGGWGKCNTEGDVCGHRKCEDPRGLQWRQLEGPEVTWSVSNPGPTGYSVNVGGIARQGKIPLTRGKYLFEGCPLPDAHDGEVPTKALEVRTGCAKVGFVVK